jgi:hypothetical protein
VKKAAEPDLQDGKNLGGLPVICIAASGLDTLERAQAVQFGISHIAFNMATSIRV